MDPSKQAVLKRAGLPAAFSLVLFIVVLFGPRNLLNLTGCFMLSVGLEALFLRVILKSWAACRNERLSQLARAHEEMFGMVLMVIAMFNGLSIVLSATHLHNNFSHVAVIWISAAVAMTGVTIVSTLSYFPRK
ncbi:hypothetical protein ACFL08_00765 [Patescibacteria group bacterium]